METSSLLELVISENQKDILSFLTTQDLNNLKLGYFNLFKPINYFIIM